MKKINITINGPIGSGKTTLMHSIAKRLEEDSKNIILKNEPSVSIPYIVNLLRDFYRDENKYAYPLQLAIGAAQEAIMTELSEKEYDYAIVDAAASTSIYAYSHLKNKRINLDQYETLESINKNFNFNFLIWINSETERLIRNITIRNKDIIKNENILGVEISNFSYIEQQLQDFEQYKHVYFQKFKALNPSLKIIEVSKVPPIHTRGYDDLVDHVCREIMGVSDGYNKN